MNERYTHIDLFSGIGGFALAARWTGFKTIVFCERDEWCQRVLAKNFNAYTTCNGLEVGGLAQQESSGQSNGISQIPIIPDIHAFDGSIWRGATLLTGGFPCQPFSCAGKRGGKADDRFLWPEMVRVIAEARPTWVIGENVRGLVTMELDRVLSDLEGIGYAVWPVIIPACAVDAKHRRDRVWIICHAEHAGFDAAEIGRSIEQGNDGSTARTKQASKLTGSSEQHEDVAHSEQFGRRGRRNGDARGNDGKIQTAGSCATDKPEDVANANDNEGARQQQYGRQVLSEQKPIRFSGGGNTLADPIQQQWNRWGDGVGWWEREPLETLQDAQRDGRQENGLPTTESLLGRVAHGIPNRVDRLKGLGNAIVPQVAAELMAMTMSIENTRPDRGMEEK